MGGFYFIFSTMHLLCSLFACFFGFGFLVTYVSELNAHAMFFLFVVSTFFIETLEDAGNAGEMDLRRAFRYNRRNLVRSPNDTAQASGNTANLQITQQRAQLPCLRITLHDCDRG